MATSRGTVARTSWALPHAVEERERFVTAKTYSDAYWMAVERDEAWHAANLVRARCRFPESWLDCIGLDHVPADPIGWCNCPPEEEKPGV